MRRRLAVIYFIVYVVFFSFIPILIPMLISAVTSADISGGGIIGVASVGLESTRTELGNFFTSGPFDPSLREIWVLVAVAIAVIIFLLKRQEVKK